MYLRFVFDSKINGNASREGFFCAAYEIMYDVTANTDAQMNIKILLDWFDANLAEPTKFNKTKSKGSYRKQHTNGLSWFKDSASLHIDKSFQLIRILEEQNYQIHTLKTKKVGYITYEDDVQIVAEPYASTPT